jgi:hypothetical protein
MGRREKLEQHWTCPDCYVPPKLLERQLPLRMGKRFVKLAKGNDEDRKKIVGLVERLLEVEPKRGPALLVELLGELRAAAYSAIHFWHGFAKKRLIG